MTETFYNCNDSTRLCSNQSKPVLTLITWSMFSFNLIHLINLDRLIDFVQNHREIRNKWRKHGITYEKLQSSLRKKRRLIFCF